MIKKIAVAVGLACLSSSVWAVDYGDYAQVTVDRLILDYPGRYRGTQNFADAADWMEQRMLSSGYTAVRQDFTWTAGGTSRASQNVLVYNQGLSNDYIITGAHFDTYFNRPTLQGLDDNASGAAILTEIARNFSGVQTEKTLVFAAFGAEEEGLRGSQALVNALRTEGYDGNLKAMINMDSMITGDMLYAHAGENSVANPALASLREHTFRIAKELGIELFTNPGLNTEYPAGTGCCSDGDSFNNAFNIPVLYMEATNWEIGDLDGYEQTTNPAIPGGATWHDPALDNETVLTDALGPDRVAQRLSDVSRLISRLLLEISDTDRLHSAISAANMQRALEDSVKRQHQSLADLHSQRWSMLQDLPRRTGSLDGAVGIEGQQLPSSGFDLAPQKNARAVMAYALLDYTLSDSVTVGGSLSIMRNTDELERDGQLKSNTWQAGVYSLWQDGGPLWAAGDISGGRASIDTRRNVHIQSAGGPVLLDNTLSGETEAQFVSTRLMSGYDFSLGAWRTGPLVEMDYTHYRINGFDDRESLRTAVRYEKQNLNSLEARLGWRLRGNIDLNSTFSLHPYASVSWVNELADGLNDRFTVHARDGSGARSVEVASSDKHFGRAALGLQWVTAKHLNIYTEVGSRFAHDEGDQTQYTLGLQWMF